MNKIYCIFVCFLCLMFMGLGGLGGHVNDTGDTVVQLDSISDQIDSLNTNITTINNTVNNIENDTIEIGAILVIANNNLTEIYNDVTNIESVVNVINNNLSGVETELDIVSNHANSILTEVDKIDNVACDGIDGVQDSLCYTVGLLERHDFSGGRWYGIATTPSANHNADRIGPGVQPFVLTSGNNAWGAWTIILDNNDTPADAGKLYYNPHAIQVVETSDDQSMFLQFTRGEIPEDGRNNNLYTELAFKPDSNKVDSGIINFKSGRAPASSKLWGRIMVLGENAKTLSFYIGLHEYEG